MNIAAVVITYHPDKSLLYKNIKAFADHVNVIIIWRNSLDNLDYLDEWKSKIIFMGDGHNAYIAKPLNLVIDFCIKQNYAFLLTMDQDSCWENFGDFVETIDVLPKDPSVAIYAPNVNNYLKDESIIYRDIEWVIQSGMLLDLDVIKKYGGFREDYKIYGVDEEFCYWMRLHGKKVRSFTHFHLIQRFGNVQKSWLGFYVYNYSPMVRYFLIRNMIWMKREFKESTLVRRIVHVFLLNFRDILLVENNKLPKLKKLFLGVIHGLFKSINKRSPIHV